MNEIRFRTLVVEGPAGSGKSTLIQTLLDCRRGVMARLPFPVNYQRPRAYTGYEGVILSQFKDYCQLLAMIQGPTTQAYIFDRFLLSQWVYGTIRKGKPHLEFETGMGLANSTIDLFFATFEQLRARLGSEYLQTSTRVCWDLEFYVMIPDVPLLRVLRSRHPEKYTYDPAIEIQFYTEAVELLSEWLEMLNEIHGENGSLKFSITPLRFSSIGMMNHYHEKLRELYDRINLS